MTIFQVEKVFIGYGHYELSIVDSSGNRVSAITGNMDLITRLNSELEKERIEATTEAIAFIQNSF